MKEEIKQLRVKIDGLAQLTRELKPKSLFKVDINKIPESWNVEEWWIKYFEKTGYAIEDSFNKSDKLSEPIAEYIPTIFKEIEKATDSLYLAKAWLGKILQELGDSTPYINDGNRKTVEDIEGVADKSPVLNNIEHFCKKPWSEKSHIEKVDWLRQEIKDIIYNTQDFSENIDYIELEQGFVYKYLCEARFWLGFELQRIKENEPVQ